MRARWLVKLSCWVMVVAAGARAHAGPPPSQPQPPNEPAPPAPNLAPPSLTAPTLPALPTDDTIDYRAPLVINDAIAIGLMSSRNDALILLGGAGYLTVAPITHGVHSEGLRVLGSIGVRIALPILGSAIGGGITTHPCTGSGLTFFSSCTTDDDQYNRNARLGLLFGLVAAALVDDFAIAQPRKVHRPAQLAITPTVSLDRDHHTSLGLAGQF